MHLLPEKCSWTRYSDVKLIKNISTLLVALLHFCFRKTTLKSKFSEFLFTSRRPFVAILKETCVPTSRKNLAEQGIVMSNWLNTFQTCWLHSSIFALEKQPKNVNFQSFFISRRPFDGYFDGAVMPNWSKTFENFWSHSSIFGLEK